VTELRTGRGVYRLSAAAPVEHRGDALVLTLTLERADGIERIGFHCRVSATAEESTPAEQLIAQLAPLIEREFEQIREAALKTIRTERRLLETAFDSTAPDRLRF
jgi:hypothetical protein